MADDWDLYAVVRSCTNTTGATSTASSTVTDHATIAPVENSINQSGDTNSFDFPGFVNQTGDSFFGLEDIYKYENTQPFYGNNSLPQQNHPTNSVLQTIGQNPQYTDLTPQQHIFPQPQKVIQPQQQYSNLGHGIFGSFPSTSPHPIRPRRRKNQQAKMIHQMTQEELSADTWAWRKYGQKPIKGSPYPRNYYRCSTSKGCLARKQVERCPTDPNMYVVSYSGEHSHPRPTHRSSLAGSTRSKISHAAAKPNIASSIASCSSSSPASASSFSPTTALTEGGDSAAEENADEGADTVNNEGIFSGEEEEEEGWEDDDDDDRDDILIPNTFLTDDDIIKGL
ncbi:hypothetical protein ACH5RR_017164 [Cinchona calisaya]|uniref:WRKY domain-containing protein n=1 Tax=Cinchona calisaya TaxID=153742 RepID=A0ABD2ZY00_9GENT